MGTILKVDNLKYKEILNGVTFSLSDKTFNILIGDNASGKTTLVNCIRGIINYKGNISICNKDLHLNKGLNDEVGFFMDEDLYLETTILEELFQLLINLNYTEEKAKKRIFGICKKFDITPILLKRINDLSFQELTLVSFVFSIIHEPKLLIIDNDMEGLNQTQKNKIIEYLKSQKNLTVLFITNNSEYFNIADNLLLFKNGKIILSGTLEEVMVEEKKIIKCGSKLPIIIDLSNKLISYEVLNFIPEDVEKLVGAIWQ